MIDWLIGGLVLAAMVGIAAVTLARSDRRLYLAAQSRRSTGDRIQEIREIASFHVNQFAQSMGESNERPEMFWVPQVLEYYRRLEFLAANHHSRPEDALKLAAEASDYLDHHRLKGILVAENAKRLADLIRFRDDGVRRGSNSRFEDGLTSED
jgi:hypothetical protein